MSPPRARKCLNGGRVQHAANLATHGGRRQVVLKLSPHHPACPVHPRHLAPRRAVGGALLLRLGLVHVAQLLPLVKVSGGLRGGREENTRGESRCTRRAAH